jgi:hypothetical protein
LKGKEVGWRSGGESGVYRKDEEFIGRVGKVSGNVKLDGGEYGEEKDIYD